MPFPPTRIVARNLATVLLLATSLPVFGLEVRDYEPELHDRFISPTDEPQANPAFIYGAGNYSGLGWQEDAPHKQFSLISRSHVVFATHHLSPLGSSILFLNKEGEVIERSIAAQVVVPDPDGGPSDLCLITLSSPIEESEGVTPFRYLNLPNESDYQNLELTVFGGTATAGRGKIAGFQDLIQPGINTSRSFNFIYVMASGGPDDARLQTGDSGSPSFVEIDGEPTLVGSHSGIAGGVITQVNYDTFIPHYADELNQLLADSGFRLRPAKDTPTQFAGSLRNDSTKFSSPVQVFELLNLGDDPSGNVEVEITFDQGSTPESIEGNGWIIEQDDHSWIARKALLDPAESGVLQINWAADSVPSSPSINWRSDAAPDGQLFVESGALPLSHFRVWATDLDDRSHEADLDRDGLNNLLEYALGSDPLSPDNTHAGRPLAPSLLHHAGSLEFSFPEREDKLLRGISYIVEFSRDMSAGSWTSTPPAGTLDETSQQPDAVEGFVERTLKWPLEGASWFVRLRIGLDE